MLASTHHLLTKTPKYNFSYLHIQVTLLVVPEGVRVEEGLVAEGAHQPHSQVYFVYVCTNGSLGG